MLEKITPESDKGIALVRTFAQAVGGLIVALLLRWGIDVDENEVNAIVYPVCVALWVALVDVLARYVHPGFEKLNVISKPPTYDTQS